MLSPKVMKTSITRVSSALGTLVIPAICITLPNQRFLLEIWAVLYACEPVSSISIVQSSSRYFSQISGGVKEDFDVVRFVSILGTLKVSYNPITSPW